jgi:hypothetical protein
LKEKPVAEDQTRADVVDNARGIMEAALST